MGVFGALSGLAGGVGSSFLSGRQAKKQRKFTKKMRRTAYQDTMADMRDAGLNPILAYKTGPTSSVGASAGMTPDLGQAMASGSQAESVAERNPSEVKKNEALTGQSGAQKKLLKQQERNAISQERLLEMQWSKTAAEANETSARTRLRQAEIPRAEADAQFYRTGAGKKVAHGAAAAERILGPLGQLGGLFRDLGIGVGAGRGR